MKKRVELSNPEALTVAELAAITENRTTIHFEICADNGTVTLVYERTKPFSFE